ncbi:MAG: EutN/CcmL family microcompartment protein [Eubacterium sp.]|nr:EutN/CcmL family microcompartment protein [Eubacterium sp.]
MQTAKVIGTVVATKKDKRLEGIRLMVIQPQNAAGKDEGTPIVACDVVGSGIGETVIYAKSKEGAFALPDKNACCDAAITAIIDSFYTLEGGNRRVEGC